MNLILQLSAEIEAKLKAQAAERGKPLEDVAIEAIEDVLASSESDALLQGKERQAGFERWLTGRKARNAAVDDSRDSIYPDE